MSLTLDMVPSTLDTWLKGRLYAAHVLSNLLRASITRRMHANHKPLVNWILTTQLKKWLMISNIKINNLNFSTWNLNAYSYMERVYISLL